MQSFYLGFIWYRALAQLRSESSRAYLGYLWWVLEPILYLAVFYVVFALILSRGDENYVQALLTGLVAWKWFDGAVRGSMDIIFQNAGIINKVYLPKIVFPAVAVTSHAVKFVLVFTLLLLYSLVIGNGISGAWVAIPLLMLVHALLVAACAFFVAAITPFFPDLRMGFDKSMTLLFFLSGVFYTASMVPESMLGYFRLNPVFSMIESYRQVLISQQLPEILPLVYIAILSAFIMLVGSFLLRRYDRVYPRLIY